MENSNFSRNSHNEHLGVNKMGKNIRKSPLNQPNFGIPKQQPQPQVYNISKNDFRNIVQQLTGSPSQDPLPIPPHNPPKPPSMRLQKIRPPPLMPIRRPPIPLPPAPVPFNNSINPNPNSPFFGRPGQPNYPPMPPMTPGDSIRTNTVESPISAYARYLQNSILDLGSRQTQIQSQVQPSSSGMGILPTPPIPPSPRVSNPALLPSPTSQFLLQSPTSFLNLLSPPQSPYPLLSPGFQYPPLPTPNFSFAPLSQAPGILGPCPQPPPSPSILLPSSPSGFLPILSPRWRD